MVVRLANVEGRAALIDGDEYHDVERISGGAIGPDPMDALARFDELHDLAARLDTTTADGLLADVAVGPPVPRPRNCFAVGLNYRSHAAEASMDVPDVPLVFAKFPSCIVGPTSDVELRTDTGDYEAEVVVAIGIGGRDIAPEAAWNHVAGLTAGQDISDRALQFAAKPPHFDLAKSRDTYGPIGPVLVSPDAFPDRDSVAITCSVNGEHRQTGTTASLTFDIPTLIAYISTICTLAPGDLIFTGTPDGVGAANGTFLKPGDTIVTTIDHVGSLTNVCR